jgi:hypothetical protein
MLTTRTHPGVTPTGQTGTDAALAWGTPFTVVVAVAALSVAVALAAASVPAHWLLLVAFAPVVEETVFRAGLQETLLRRLPTRRAPGALGVNVVTALAFAAAHVALHPGVLAGLTGLPALLIGRVYQQHRRLAPCIALHALCNATWLLLTGLSR